MSGKGLATITAAPEVTTTRSADCLRTLIKIPIELDNVFVARPAFARIVETERMHELDEMARGETRMDDELEATAFPRVPHHMLDEDLGNLPTLQDVRREAYPFQVRQFIVLDHEHGESSQSARRFDHPNFASCVGAGNAGLNCVDRIAARKDVCDIGPAQLQCV